MTTLNIPIDAAAQRLRQAGHVVERQGMHWRIKPPGGEFAITTADEVRALALGLPEQAQATAPAEPTQWGPQSLPIRVIRRDGGTQARVGLNEDVVQEYAEAMRDQRWDWATLKRPLVYSDGELGDYWLADGFHRIEAAQRAGRSEYRVEILKGDKRAAQLHAARANADHGLRRSRQDVQRAIELLLRDAEWARWSDREIARHVHCDHKTVGTTRGRLSSTGEIPQLTERQGADGKVRDTTGIATANAARAVLPPIIPEPRAADERLGGRLEQMDTERVAEAATTIPPDIAAAAKNLALTIEARGDRLLLYWPDEADQLDQMDPLTPDLAREWLQTEAGGAAQYRAEMMGWEQQTASDKSRVWYHRAIDGRETAAYADAALAAGDALRIAYGEAAPPGLSPEAERTTTTTTIRRGDRVQLPDGATTTVIGTPGGYIVTPAGTYGPWQLSPPSPDVPLEPRAAAVAWRTKMHTMLAQCSEHAMFRLSEMQAAVAHIDALLETRPADPLATIAAITERVVEAETWMGHDLSAPHLPAVLRVCRRELDQLADDPAIGTEAYDALSARLGDAQAQLAESEQTV